MLTLYNSWYERKLMLYFVIINSFLTLLLPRAHAQGGKVIGRVVVVVVVVVVVSKKIAISGGLGT